MKFKTLDEFMRQYEKSLDQIIPPYNYIIARLDGRSFSKFTEDQNFKKPFDDTFHDYMTQTTKYLMENSGFRIIYGYTESDEISLLFHLHENSFNRKTRKIISTLAGTASAFMSLKTNVPVSFDCRIIPLPNKELVYDYFAWRQEDSKRNSLNTYAYWTLRHNKFSPHQATSTLEHATIEEKRNILEKYGIQYDTVPDWQKRGTGCYFQTVNKTGYNPITKKHIQTKRQKLVVDEHVPVRHEYKKLIEYILEKQTKNTPV